MSALVAEVRLLGSRETGFGFIVLLTERNAKLVSLASDGGADDHYCATAACWAAIRLIKRLGYLSGGVRFYDPHGVSADFDLEKRVPVVGSPLWVYGGNFRSTVSS